MQGYSTKYNYKHSVLASAAWLKDNIAFTFTIEDVSLIAAHTHIEREYAEEGFATSSATSAAMLKVEAADLPSLE